MPSGIASSARDVYTVSRLNAEVRGVLEGFPSLWVEGEVSNLARPASGHLYFTLKDRAAQVRCAMWRARAATLRERLADGAQVLVRARVGLYEPRGEYQLIVEHLEPAGDGELRRRFEALRAALAAEGLFDESRKRPLPARLRRIGVVTSASGAALHDVLTTLARRDPTLQVVLYPSAVQGQGSVEQLCAALAVAGARRDCDVVLLVRGGGSLEDLWSFNDERVARAIVACPLPVVAGVGHEVDVTIADLAADRRAATPTAAAELVSQDASERLRLLGDQRVRLEAALARELRRLGERTGFLAHRLAQLHPGARLVQHAQRLDELDARRERALHALLAARRARCTALAARLEARSPRRRLDGLRARAALLDTRLAHAATAAVRDRAERLALAARALDAISPLATLARGYAIVDDGAGQPLREADRVAPGTRIRARLARGALLATVTGSEDDPR